MYQAPLPLPLPPPTPPSVPASPLHRVPRTLKTPKLLLTRELVSAEERQTELSLPWKWEEAGHGPHQPCSHLDTSTLQPYDSPKARGSHV